MARLVASAVLILAAAPVRADLIDTFPSWNGSDSTGGAAFVIGDRALVGQTFAVGSTDTRLTTFSVAVGASSIIFGSTTPFTAVVQAFDTGTNSIIGPVLFQSPLQTPPVSGFGTYTFTPDIDLNPNSVYAFYLITEPNVSGPVALSLGAVADSYAGGLVISGFSSGAIGSQMSVDVGDNDLAFSLALTGAVASGIRTTPEPATLAVFAGLVGVGGLIARRRAT